MYQGIFYLVVLWFSTFRLHASEALLKQGMQHYEQGRYFQALDVFASLRESKKFRDKATFGIALTLSRLRLLNLSVSVLGDIVKKGPRNPLFRQAVVESARIYEVEPTGRSLTYQMFREDWPTLVMPTEAKGFYHYFLAYRHFSKKNFLRATQQLMRVPRGGRFYSRSQYLLGLINAISKKPTEALSYFSRALETSDASFREIPLLGMARIYYELKDYRRALSLYSQIGRKSFHWPQALFEGGIAFFQMQKHNNTLGNMLSVLSPFFAHRFFPEAYLVNAITFLRLCHYDEVNRQIQLFRERYKDVPSQVNQWLSSYRNQPEAFYSFVDREGVNYDNTSGKEQLINELRRSGGFLANKRILLSLKEEGEKVERLGGRINNANLISQLRTRVNQMRILTARESGEDMLSSLVLMAKYVKSISDSFDLLLFDLEAGKTDLLRARYREQKVYAKEELWGEGMKPLVLTQEIEYWKVGQEWWSDEVGSVVAQVESKCRGE